MALARVLGPVRATGLGAGSMLGAGVFVALGPAVGRTGVFVVWAVLLAALVAGLNALASARLASRYPAAGGTYVFARERLGPAWGHLAGWVFVVGKTASCAAMALAVGAHLAPGHATTLAVVAVAVLTAVDLAGARRSADALTVSAVLVVLVVGTSSLLVLGEAPRDDGTGYAFDLQAVPQAAALLFFAFAGYARLATLGEEVRDPERTIPRAVAVSFAVVTVLYVVAAAAVAHALPPDVADASGRAVADAVETLGHPALTTAVAVTAVVAAGGALLSLLGGVSRTTLAMSRDRHLPRALAHESSRGVPAAAQVAVALVVVAALPFVDAVEAVAASSGCVLVYYALTNAAAVTLGGTVLRVLAFAGLVGCVLLVLSLPLAGVLWTGAVVLVGLVAGRLTLARTAA
ncbi:APA family basic amino acid/polyamine antiporter [Aeromicrobium sp. SORGH_AS981]|uniref:APC family permease n=1 Tax=Aeromicrobium sp. SORGH_AS_0981 TaxID=3041802 RepID=UPI0028669097|nr:APC family permease [Aeromicrobium sp. SORGH_AS_0981]MDR6119660.1 APA family basic amino acid/polyamine antiporter [Aeromicrobium sp. SORGH_AS_0981]